MQRLTRYPLLLAQILRYTDETAATERALLREAMSKAEAVLQATNEAIREQESDYRLHELSETLHFSGSWTSISLASPSRLLGRRRLLKEGVLLKGRRGAKAKEMNACAGAVHQRFQLTPTDLCNDMLVLAQGSTIYKNARLHFSSTS